MGRAEEALAAFERAVSFDPDYRLVRAWRGSLRLSRGDFEGAVEDLDSALQAKPANAWTLQKRALANRGLGRLDAMVRDLTACVQRFTRYQLLYMGHSEGAQDSVGVRLDSRSSGGPPEGPGPEDLDRAVEALPDDPWTRTWRGRVRINTGQPERALEDLDRALSLDPSLLLARAWKGEALLRLGLPIPALEALEEATQGAGPEGPTAPVLALRATALSRAGKAGWLEDLAEAARRDPPHARLYHAWAGALARASRAPEPGPRERTAAAELSLRAEDVRAALELADSAVHAGAGCEARILRGLAKAQAGDPSAEAALEEAVRFDPARAAAELGRLRRELTHLGEAAVVLVLVAEARAWGTLGRWREALAALDPAVEIRPGDPAARRMRAAARGRLGDLQGSLRDLEEARASRGGGRP